MLPKHAACDQEAAEHEEERNSVYAGAKEVVSAKDANLEVIEENEQDRKAAPAIKARESAGYLLSTCAFQGESSAILPLILLEGDPISVMKACVN